MSVARLLLAGGLTRVGRLDAVHHGVSHEVQHRAEERVGDGLVDVDVFTGGDDANLFAFAGRGVADREAEALEEELEGNHASAGDLALDARHDAAVRFRVGGEGGRSSR